MVFRILSLSSSIEKSETSRSTSTTSRSRPVVVPSIPSPASASYNVEHTETDINTLYLVQILIYLINVPPTRLAKEKPRAKP